MNKKMCKSLVSKGISIIWMVIPFILFAQDFTYLDPIVEEISQTTSSTDYDITDNDGGSDAWIMKLDHEVGSKRRNYLVQNLWRLAI